MSSRVVKTRFTPSAAGLLYFGNARPALCSVLYARHCEGIFVLRSEDTAQERDLEEFSADLQEDLASAGGGVGAPALHGGRSPVPGISSPGPVPYRSV
ncbi:MAG: glutamate--tRNA ligase family protein [Gammaproteobacteria bacterium]|jgi:glutamyl/glutaminyl-tRNA synthetase